MRARLGLLAGLVILGAGCRLGLGAVEVEPHQPLPGTTEACADLMDALPEVVADAVRQDVDPPSPGVAAWGSPPIILRCGVVDPVIDPSTSALEVSGVGWVPVTGSGGTFFYTVDRAAVVEVAIPDDYAPEADVLVDLAPAVLGTDPAVNEDPAGGSTPA